MCVQCFIYAYIQSSFAVIMYTLLPLLFSNYSCMSSCVLSDLLQHLTGMQAVNGMQAIYEPFEVICIQAFMVSYVKLSLP